MYDFIYYQVRDVMVSNPVTVTRDTLLSEAEAIFARNDFNGLPVVDESGRLAGIVTKLDILKAFVFTGKLKVPPYDAIMAQKVSRVMTENLRSVEAETPLTRVLNKMIETGHKSFPVVQGEMVVGIVAREDVLKALRWAAEGQPPARLAGPMGENKM